MPQKRKAQIAIEFLLLTSFALFFFFIILIVLSNISSDNQKHRIQTSIEDLGTSVKNEIITASEMENGYNRNLYLPSKIEGQEYNITLNNESNKSSYLIIRSGLIEQYFDIPKISGTIASGNNIISKQESLIVTHIS